MKNRISTLLTLFCVQLAASTAFSATRTCPQDVDTRTIEGTLRGITCQEYVCRAAIELRNGFLVNIDGGKNTVERSFGAGTGQRVSADYMTKQVWNEKSNSCVRVSTLISGKLVASAPVEQPSASPQAAPALPAQAQPQSTPLGTVVLGDRDRVSGKGVIPRDTYQAGTAPLAFFRLTSPLGREQTPGQQLAQSPDGRIEKIPMAYPSDETEFIMGVDGGRTPGVYTVSFYAKSGQLIGTGKFTIVPAQAQDKTDQPSPSPSPPPPPQIARPQTQTVPPLSQPQPAQPQAQTAQPQAQPAQPLAQAVQPQAPAKPAQPQTQTAPPLPQPQAAPPQTQTSQPQTQPGQQQTPVTASQTHIDRVPPQAPQAPPKAGAASGLPAGFIAVSTTRMRWDEAKAWCEQRGGRLPLVGGKTNLTPAENRTSGHLIEGFGRDGPPGGDRCPAGLPGGHYWTGTSFQDPRPNWSIEWYFVICSGTVKLDKGRTARWAACVK